MIEDLVFIFWFYFFPMIGWALVMRYLKYFGYDPIDVEYELSIAYFPILNWIMLILATGSIIILAIHGSIKWMAGIK